MRRGDTLLGFVVGIAGGTALGWYLRKRKEKNVWGFLPFVKEVEEERFEGRDEDSIQEAKEKSEERVFEEREISKFATPNTSIAEQEGKVV